MTIIIAGTLRVPRENQPAFRPQQEAMLVATRAEDGCLAYSYAVDVQDPGLNRVFEVWRDLESLEAHLATPQMAVWRAASPQFGVSDHRFSRYEVFSERPL